MAFDWTSLIGPTIGALGTGYAANQAAGNATTSANQAAQMAQFRPVGVTTRFGRSGFNYGPQGELVGAGYQVAPDIAAMREGLIGMAGTGLSQVQQAQAMQPKITTAGQGLFNLGQQYIAQTPQGAAQQFLAQQQGLLAPGREQQLAQLTNQQQQQGRLGLATGATSAGYGIGAPAGGIRGFSGSMDAGGNIVNKASSNPDFNSPYFSGFSAMESVNPYDPAVSSLSSTPFMDGGGFMPAQQPMQASPMAMSPAGGSSQGSLGMEADRAARLRQTQAFMPSTTGAYMGPDSFGQPQQPSFGVSRQGATSAGYGMGSPGLQATNPQMAAYYNAIAMQDAQLAAQANLAGQQQVTFGQGLMRGGLDLQNQGYGLQSNALAPYTNLIGGAQNVENLGMNALTASQSLGSAAAGGNQAAANQYMSGQNIANQANRSALQGAVAGLTDPVAALIAGLTR
jgi:hypothetical protein